MPKQRVGVLVLMLALAASGCGGGAPEDQPPPAPDQPVEEPARLGDHIDTSLAELLRKPRAELAVMADDLLVKTRVREKAHRQTHEVYLLLPELHLPLAVPVLREASYSETAGFSLPPYLKAGTHDTPLALHLARYGDVEAARRLADPTDADAPSRINECAYDRNYPVEWARLVGLHFHTAESRAATGDIDGATELVQLHRQLKEVLDAKAARGPLGALLLPRGRLVLAQARAAWAAHSRQLLAEDIEHALAAWGELPGNTVHVPVGSPRAEVTRLLDSPAQGRVVPAVSVARALDVFGLPLPDSGVDGVFAFLDGSDRLTQVLVVYHERTEEYFPRPADLAFLVREQLTDAVAAAAEDAGGHGLRRHVYGLGDLSCDVTVVGRNNAVGGLVRCLSAAGSPGPQGLPRDLGAVHLDRSFEQNRLRLAPEQRGEEVRSERPDVLAGIRSPLPDRHLAAALLQRAGVSDLVARLTLHYQVEQTPPLPQTVLPLWAAWGPAQVEGIDDDNGGHLALQWEDAKTRYTLRLPHQTTDRIDLEVADRHASQELERRVADAVAFDRAERQAHFAAGKLLTRLPRSAGLDTIRLGMERPAVEKLLPGGKGVFGGKLPDGFVVTFAGNPPRGAAVMVRQLFLRFDAAGRLAEMRARYQDTSPPNAPARGLPGLLAGLKQRGGAPETVPAAWASAWPELPARKPAPVCYRWLDDATLLTCQTDGAGAEVIVRDRPADQEGGVALAPLEYLPRGPEGCSLGDGRDVLLRRWNVTEPVLAGDALVLTPAEAGPYDALLVWFDNGRVSRIVARHVQSVPPPTLPQQLAQALQDAWARDLRRLGWPRRQDVSGDDVLNGLGWHDERTRVRLFWQEPEKGTPRVYTEWQGMP
jgi:hypothetical protein